MKHPRRKLTAREVEMRKLTRLVRFSDGWTVFFAVDVQGFAINQPCRIKRDAEWLRDTLAITLAKIK